MIQIQQARPRHAKATPRAADDPLWYRNAVIYELHVRAFRDSDGDGVGDFRGLTEKLDYLQDLGVTAIWLLPFYPSPLRDDGYDIADYLGVNPAYGSMDDVKRFIAEAHKRDLRVITELVLNHTSDQHPWFQQARHAPPGSRRRDFYVWSDDPTKYSGVRIIFQDFETSNWSWDPVAKSYYWHRFYSHQPDLNFENPAVHVAMLRVVDQWFAAGVDGLRLDAVPYLYEREGTNCENLPETHAFLKKLRAHVDARFPGRMLLAEANQWPEDAISYFGDGDECNMAFHFPLMPRLFMGLRMEDHFPIIDILRQTPPIPSNCQWALFLRNHDELTLEMVTDEERDYMYRVYAEDRQARINLGIRRRLAPLLGNNRRKIELLNALLFSLPGVPVIYYGDELGMGDNVYLGDRNGVRTPMQWSSDRNAGFSGASPQRLFLPIITEPEYHYESINVESQQNNLSSLLWWMKRLIALRKRHPVFGRGELEFLPVNNPKALVFVRRDEQETVLVVANLSRFAQPVEIDLSKHRDATPVEIFGGVRFPPVGERPFFLSLGPHSFYWFLLKSPTPAAADAGAPGQEAAAPARVIEARGEPAEWLLSERCWRALEPALVDDLPRRRWFMSKSKAIRSVTIIDGAPIRTTAPPEELSVAILFAQVNFVEADPEVYALPLAVASPLHFERLQHDQSATTLARPHFQGRDDAHVLYDAMTDPVAGHGLYEMITRTRRARAASGEIAATRTRFLRRDDAPIDSSAIRVSRAEQSNSSVVIGDKYILKLFRKVEPGRNPDLEIVRHLSERAGFEHTPALAGAIEYSTGRAEPRTLAMLQVFVPNQGDAWRYTLDELGRFYERAASAPTHDGDLPDAMDLPASLLDARDPPDAARALFGDYISAADLLGRRTAEMHVALANSAGDPAFAPERFSTFSQRAMYQSMRNTAQRTLALLRRHGGSLPEEAGADLAALLDHESELIGRLRAVSQRPIDALRCRCHGDYHLGQVLWTGKDFMIIDFEGEPARSLGERRLKNTPLRDVAGMLRSFQYAAYAGLREQAERGMTPHEGLLDGPLGKWASHWQKWMGALFMRSYLSTARAAMPGLVPDGAEELGVLLDAWLIEKALYEVSYELNSRPAWAPIPIRALREMLEPDRAPV